ncbi:hypothetical protein FJ364_01085 [Candidatus Dependentiae bacterium]|nr:hypothetical protein [Candidatus Dependentiae bacterium]
MLKVFKYFLATCALFFLNGCVYYVPRALRSQVYGSKVENKLVKVTARELNKADLDFYFKQNLNSNRMHAIQVNIFNQTATPLFLEGHSIDLELEETETIANLLHYNTIGHVILWSIPGIFYWPFFIGATADGYNCLVQNKRINEDLEQKILTNHTRLTIRPHASVNKVMFVRDANYYNNFTLSFARKDTKEIIDVSINI